MGSLSSILNNRAVGLTIAETNLQQGTIYSFAPGVQLGEGSNIKTFCWNSPGNGTAQIEIWGAAGSGARVGCCGHGVPGNPGAYASKTIAVTGASFICGNVGLPCNNFNDQLYRGVSESTCVCWSSTSTGAMCAQGGNGGCGVCAGTSIPLSCCFCDLCKSVIPGAGDGCMIVCNYCCLATATGGDINCSGGFSCASFYHCNACCICSHQFHIATPAGLFSTKGGQINYKVDVPDFSNISGQNYTTVLAAINALSRSPSQGSNWTACWANHDGCACYTGMGAISYMPPGMPGPSGMSCQSVIDAGAKGGVGIVRIRFIGA